MATSDDELTLNAKAEDAADDANPTPRLALRPKDATKALGIGPRLLWTMTNRGEIPHVRMGRRAVTYPVDELRRWLAELSRKKGGCG